MKDSEYITRNEPVSAEARIDIADLLDAPLKDETPRGFSELRNHLRKCERLLQLPATHLSGPDRYTVEMAMDNPDSYQIKFVEKLYAAREREAHLRCEDWEGGEA
jgi:hypothetical protein